jgi:hypothetical protein
MSAFDFSFKIFDQNIYYIDVEVIHIKKIKLSDSQLIKNIFNTPTLPISKDNEKNNRSFKVC